MNDDRQNKVVSMYNTGKTVNINYKQQAPDYGDMIRQRAQPVICEPLVRDTLDWLTVSYDWLDSETVHRVLTCLEPQIEQLKAERQIAVDRAKVSLCALTELDAANPAIRDRTRILQQLLQFEKHHVSNVSTLNIVLATEHLNQAITQSHCSSQQPKPHTPSLSDTPFGRLKQLLKS